MFQAPYQAARSLNKAGPSHKGGLEAGPFPLLSPSRKRECPLPGRQRSAFFGNKLRFDSKPGGFFLPTGWPPEKRGAPYHSSSSRKAVAPQQFSLRPERQHQWRGGTGRRVGA